MLARRLVTERDRIREAFAGHWVPALSAAAGNRMFDVAALVASLLAVGADANPFLVLLAYVVSLALALVPITPGGLGFVEAGLTSLLVLAGASAQEAVVATLLYRLASFWLPIPLGLVAWGGWRARRRTAGMSDAVSDAPRLVATDLDGTIVPDGRRDQRPHGGGAAARSRRSACRWCSSPAGRPRWMAEVAERTGHTGLAICANGAVLYDLHTEQIVEHYPIPVEVGLEVARRLRAAVPGSRLRGRDAGRLLPRAGVRAALGRRATSGPSPPLETIYDGPARQAAGPARGAGPGRVAGRRPRGGRRPGRADPLRRRSALLEISAAGVSKASGLARFADRHGVDAADVVAFGDMPNDLPMLAWAGRAVRRRERPPRGARRGDRLVAGPSDDGVARELELLFDL